MTPVKCFFIEPTGETRTEPSGCGDPKCCPPRSVDIYRRTDTGQLTTLHDAPVGAMWYADWYGAERRGPDGHYLVVRVPTNHDWCVDSRCSNCTLPNDDVHRCWVRHGVPPVITVDKAGLTCKAGAGSLGVHGGPNGGYRWHGFLRNGYLVE